MNTADIPAVDKLRRTSFLRLIAAVTDSGAKLRRAVDYVTGFFVNDSFDVFGRIINRFCVTEMEQKNLLAEREVVRRHLKYGFDSGVKNKTRIAHSIPFGLCLLHSTTESNKLCACCRRVYWFFDVLKKSHLRESRRQWQLFWHVKRRLCSLWNIECGWWINK